MEFYLPPLFIIFYYFSLVFSFLFNIKLNKKELIVINGSFLVSVIFFAYNFKPSIEMDLYRYYKMLDEVRSFPLNARQILTYGPYKDTILTSTYFNIMSKFDSYGLFQTLPILLVFILLFYWVYFFYTQYNIKFRSISFYLVSIISVSSYLLILTGIRQDVAWALLMSAIYYEFFSNFKNRWINLMLYILPVLIHLSVFPILVLRVILFVTKKIPSFKYLLVVWPATLLFFTISYNFLPRFLKTTFEILQLYSGNSEVNQFTAQYLVSTIGYLIMYFIVVMLRKTNQLDSSINNEYYEFYLMVILFGVSSIFVPTLSSRIYELLMYISLPIYSNIFAAKFHFRKGCLVILLAMYLTLFYWQDLMLGYLFMH